MSYNLQQAIDLSRRTIIRGFRQDETHSALCSHLFTMIRGNRQHRRAFLISLLKLFDDNAVSKFISLSGLICRDVNKTTGLAMKKQTLELNVGYYKQAPQCEFNAMSSSFFYFLQKTEVNMLLFIADNLACFPYQSQEEPLFIMHHIDITLSVSGSNLLQTFKEVQ